jgi:hypothetical protein
MMLYVIPAKASHSSDSKGGDSPLLGAGIHQFFKNTLWIPAFAGMTILFATFSHAQGFLPQPSTSTTATGDMTRPLLIGDTVPETLAVIGENGKKRTLLSYKAPTELLVVVFFSVRCPQAQVQWHQFRRLNEQYKDWRVAFVAVNTSVHDMLTELSDQLKQEKLPWPAVQDDQREATSFLKITGTPEVLIIDEYGVLKYRGPLAGAPKALDTVIGHIDTLKDPEPPLTGGCAL